MKVKKYCNKLAYGKFCQHGCIEVNGEAQYVCHKFMRGRCKHSPHDCEHGLHYKPQRHRGDGFRPYTTETAAEQLLKQHLATLGLSPFCENLLDYDVDLLETIYRKSAKRRHPDKNANGATGTRFIELTKAKDYIKERLPFRIAS